MASESTTSSDPRSKLKSDNLEFLSEGDIYVDEKGKKYRVHKTIMSDRFIGGPHGLGDPEDRTLRRVEADVVVPNKMNQKIEKELCNDYYMKLVSCMRQEGGAAGLYKCVPERDLLNDCKKKYFLDPKFRQQMTEEYLNERAEVRRTGMTVKERELQKYREWKKTQEQNNR
ncbi:hypothetical protein FO519_006643 [Halicephalobus sp. NKZ332]|nr:hypothetical protein FO519_006643 [Halicephalobus sp. NKZ332]